MEKDEVPSLKLVRKDVSTYVHLLTRRSRQADPEHLVAHEHDESRAVNTVVITPSVSVRCTFPFPYYFPEPAFEVRGILISLVLIIFHAAGCAHRPRRSIGLFRLSKPRRGCTTA